MFALAQHGRVPTRLLDWTVNPLIAAYFSAVEVAEARSHSSKRARIDGPNPERFAVWALSRSFVETMLHKKNPGIDIVTVPTASNPNLLLQKGLFTLVVWREDRALAAQPLPALDALFSAEPYKVPRDAAWMYPALYKFTVPASNARWLLRVLSLSDITAATVFPGYESVHRAMLERAWYQDCDDPAERS